MSAKKKPAVSPIYVIVGKDAFLVSRAAQPLIDSLLSEDEKEMGYTAIDGPKADIAEVLDDLRTLPFLSPIKVTYIRDADPFVTANREILTNYLDSPATKGVLILHVSTWRKNTNLAKKVAEVGTTIDTGEIKSYKLADFAVEYAASEHKKRLKKRSGQFLVELTGDDPGKICSEIDKLAVFAIDTPEITEEHISQLTGNNREYDIFKVIDAMAKADTSRAVQRLRNMFASGSSAEFTVVSALASHFRRIFRIKNFQQQRLSPAAIAAKMGMSPWWFGKFTEQASIHKWQFNDLASIIKALARIDYQAKTGQTSVPAAIEQIVVKVCIRMRRR